MSTPTLLPWRWQRESGEVRSLGRHTEPSGIDPEDDRQTRAGGKAGDAATRQGRQGTFCTGQTDAVGGGPAKVIAPSLVPTKSGDRVKTDRRDAEKLARCHRAGELTAVWVPDAAHEALRDLVRAREAAKKDQLRHRHRLGKFLLRHGQRPTSAGEPWTKKYLNWIRIHARFEEPALEATLAHYLGEVEHASERIAKLEQAIDEAVKQAPWRKIRAVIEALQALRGVAQTTAATVVCATGAVCRVSGESTPTDGLQRTGFREYSCSGNRTQRGAITKSGNAASAPGSGGVGLGVARHLAQCSGAGC